MLVVFDFPPYEPVVSGLARYADRQHAKVVVFTAAESRRRAAYARVGLPCDAFAGQAPVMALLEAVRRGVFEALGEDGEARRGKAELIAAELAARRRWRSAGPSSGPSAGQRGGSAYRPPSRSSAAGGAVLDDAAGVDHQDPVGDLHGARAGGR